MLFKRKIKTEAKKIPKPVLSYMTNRFDLLPEYVDMLQCFDYDCSVNGKQVKLIRIFNPYQAHEHCLPLKTCLDLEQHPEMLLYEGYVDSQGNIYIADRRMGEE